MSKPYDYVVLSAKNKVNLKALVLGYNSMGYVCLGGVSVSRSDDEVIYDQAMERVATGICRDPTPVALLPYHLPGR